jgi:hypothetical protein
MPSRAERSFLRLLADGLLAVLLVLAAIPAYLTLEPSWRPLAVRVACALIVVAGCLRVTRRVRRSIDGYAPSVLEAPPAVAPAPELDERFLRLRDELVFGSRSRRHFDLILWPRLLRLAGASLPRPAERHGIFRDGPSLSVIERLVAEAERRP